MALAAPRIKAFSGPTHNPRINRSFVLAPLIRSLIFSRLNPINYSRIINIMLTVLFNIQYSWGYSPSPTLPEILRPNKKGPLSWGTAEVYQDKGPMIRGRVAEVVLFWGVFRLCRLIRKQGLFFYYLSFCFINQAV